LDYAPCTIQNSGDSYLDTLVQEFIQSATTEGMSRSEQVQACYDYMVANYSYGSNSNYNYADSRHSVAWATAFLRDGYGTCNEWSSAFVYILRALGYDTDLYYGATAASGGGSAEHYWPVVHIDGVDYVFDPQVEGDLTRKSGVNAHKRFGLYGSSANAKYYFSQIVD
jgi:transglutaminase-like putative cysteine protease